MSLKKTFKQHGYGQVIVGSVEDVNKKYLERAMQDYDKQLYLKWNPIKRYGLGMWEVRRRSNEKTSVYYGQWQGVGLYRLEPVENDWVNHVMDVEFLNYDILTRLKEMDTWGDKYALDNMEYNEEKAQERIKAGAREEMRYAIKQEKRAIREFRELVLSGHNPAAFLTGLK